MKYWVFIVFFSVSVCCLAQKSFKHEKEARIEKKEFPTNALQLLEKTLPQNVKRLKYYREQDSSKVSYEVKLKYKKRKYSIEFDTNGTLEDVEVTIRKKKLPKATLQTIERYLQDNYDAFRIKKIQRQYRKTETISAEKVILNAFSNERSTSYRYEIIAEVKTQKKRYFIEITFAKDGTFELVRTIIRSSYDHILY